MKNLQHSLRHLKNDLIYRYYDFRIKNSQSPYQVFGKKDRYKVIFILSHMRSGSSLLTHLLISNPEIKGYGESHIRYQTDENIKSLIYKTYFHNQQFTNLKDLSKLKMDHTYILDKLLHDKKLLNQDFLTKDNFYFVFLIREPQRSLMSMLDHKPHWKEEDAMNYYCQRLSTLSEYSTIIGDKSHSLAFTYTQLINQTDYVFQALQKFLKTDQGFSEKYQVLKTTGKRNIGDFKENIRSGRIIRKQRSINFSISPHLLEEAKEKFEQCRSILQQYCQIIDD